MKRFFCLMLVLSLFVCLYGCREETVPEDTYPVYYQRQTPTYGADDSVIAQTTLLASGHKDDIPYLLRKYLASQPGEGFVTPFPETVTLISFKLEGLTAKVVLSNEIAQLSGMKLTIALACLTRTVMTLTDCQEVIISANTTLLAGQNYITLTRDSYLFIDSSGDANEQQK